MKTMFKYWGKLKNSHFKKIFLLVLLLSNGYLFAQNNNSPVGPFSYMPPDGIFWYGVNDPSTKKSVEWISPYYFTQINTNEDCMMLEFDIDIDMDNDEGKPILSLVDPYLYGIDVRLFEMFYSDGTVTIKRYNRFLADDPEGPDDIPFYTYHLFDRLFERHGTEGSATWRMRVYITSNFMYIVTTDWYNNPDVQYMSPVFFGLDFDKKYPDEESNMYRYFAATGHRNNTLAFILGEWTLSGNNTYAPYISNTKVFIMVYSSSPRDDNDWWWTMQREFSSPPQ
ncbi:hypothetical protein [Viscerimonas tarda]